MPQCTIEASSHLRQDATSIDKIESNLVRHNMVVFQQGERALQVPSGQMAAMCASSQICLSNLLTPASFRHALCLLHFPVQVLPPLVGLVPEARLNLVIFHMHNNEVQEAYDLMKEVEPTSPQEYILKGVTNLALGQHMDSREHLKVK